jgi:hypothetical protein
MQLISSTTIRGSRLLGGDADTLMGLHRSFAAIAENVSEPGASHFLAEPAINTRRGQVEWYTPLDGELRNFRDLGAAEQQTARERIERIRAALDGVVAQLKQSGDSTKQLQAEGLELALLHGEQDIYLVGEQPVLSNWGAVKATDSAGPAALTAQGVSQVAVGAGTVSGGAGGGSGGATAVAVQRRPRDWRRWLGWLLALLVLLLLPLVLTQCTPGSLGWVGDEKSLADAQAEEARLRRQLAELRIRLDEGRRGCADCGGPQRPEFPSAEGGPGSGLTPSPPMDEQEFCERMAREVGECDPGNLTVSLAWDTLHDLDLGVETPTGEFIHHELRNGEAGGGLILDYNVEPEERITEPVESVSWGGTPPPGRYRVRVKLHDIDPRQADVDPVPVTVRITLGEQTDTISGAIPHSEKGRWNLVGEFTVP